MQDQTKKKAETENISTIQNTTDTEKTLKEIANELSDGKSLDDLRKEQETYFEKKKKRNHKETSKRGKEYLQELRSKKIFSLEAVLSRVDKETIRPQKEIKQICSFDAGKQIAIRICENRLRQIDKNNAFELSRSERQIFNNMVKYFIGHTESEYDLSKGLYLFGNVGVGKTFLIKSFQLFCNVLETKERSFQFVTCSGLTKSMQDKNNTSETKKHYVGNWCFDDFGDEPGNVKSYGNDLAVMDDILTNRYNNFVNGLCITHMTSNLTPPEVEDIYGLRIADRLRQMMNFIFFDGSSKRQ